MQRFGSQQRAFPPSVARVRVVCRVVPFPPDSWPPLPVYRALGFGNGKPRSVSSY